MAEFLDNNDNLIKEELLTYYHFRASLIKHINDRMESIKTLTQSTEYDYCTVAGQIRELENLNAFLKENARHTEVSKIAESTEKTNPTNTTN
jgi:hypothetical protein